MRLLALGAICATGVQIPAMYQKLYMFQLARAMLYIHALGEHTGLPCHVLRGTGWVFYGSGSCSGVDVARRWGTLVHLAQYVVCCAVCACVRVHVHVRTGGGGGCGARPGKGRGAVARGLGGEMCVCGGGGG